MTRKLFWEDPYLTTLETTVESVAGGTHLKRTGEVGRISLKRKNPGKGKGRIEVFAAGYGPG